MIGGLLGAYLGNTSSHISRFVCNQLICYHKLFAIFKKFVLKIYQRLCGIDVRAMDEPFSFLDLEEQVTRRILDVPNGQRNAHYNSLSASRPPPTSARGGYLPDISPSFDPSPGYPQVDHQKIKQQICQFLLTQKEILRLESVENLYVRAYLQPDILDAGSKLSEEERKFVFIECWYAVQAK